MQPEGVAMGLSTGSKGGNTRKKAMKVGAKPRAVGAATANGSRGGAGRRERHQKPDGYEVSVNRTLAIPVAAVIEAFENPKVRAKWIAGEKFEIRGVTPGKAVRITWGDGTNVVVGFYGPTAAKARVSV